MSPDSTDTNFARERCALRATIWPYDWVLSTDLTIQQDSSRGMHSSELFLVKKVKAAPIGNGIGEMPDRLDAASCGPR